MFNTANMCTYIIMTGIVIHSAHGFTRIGVNPELQDLLHTPMLQSTFVLALYITLLKINACKNTHNPMCVFCTLFLNLHGKRGLSRIRRRPHSRTEYQPKCILTSLESLQMDLSTALFRKHSPSRLCLCPEKELFYEKD